MSLRQITNRLLRRSPEPTGDHDIPLPADLVTRAQAAKGFLEDEEGAKLYALAAEASREAPCLEVGSYCGKSTLYLAAGCRATGCHPLFAVDHHRGSEEQQVGEQYFDPDLFDSRLGLVDTLDVFRGTIHRASLSDWVIPVIAESERLARYWPKLELGLVFIDGAHGQDDVWRDFHGWSPQIRSGGYLCMHDIYADPTDGGQAPYVVFEHARTEGSWEHVGQWGSLGVLRRH